MGTEHKYDTIVIGAGPAGLAVANSLQKNNNEYVVLERKFIGYNISRFPVCMTFFSGRALLEIDDFALTIPEDKPNREQYMTYLFHFAKKRHLNIMGHTEVVSISKDGSIFNVTAQDRDLTTKVLQARSIVCACGALDNPQMLHAEGEHLPNVSHYFNEVYPYVGHSVLVVGSGNSAVEAALKLYRAGARVNLSHREPSLNAEKIKYWLYPDIEKRFLKNEIGHFPSTVIKKIEFDKVMLQTPAEKFGANSRSEEFSVPTDFVLALTGYNPPVGFLKNMGIRLDETNQVPEHNPETLETNVAGLFIAGVLTGGNISGKVFIENSRHHGDLIAARILEIRKAG